MKTKRFMSLMLATLLVISALAGCTSQKEEQVENTSGEATVASTGETAGKTEEKKEEPTVITIASTMAVQTEPVAWYETEVWTKIQEEANVKIEYQQLDEELFNLMLTSGEIPDIVLSNIGGKVDDIVKSGLALDMNGYMDEFAPNMVSDTFAQRNELVSTMKGGDQNALYFIAPRIGMEEARGAISPGRGYSVRWDWYKEIGAPEIKNDEDYLNVLEQIVAAHPTNENGDKVYGIGTWDYFSQWYMRAAFLKTVALNPWAVSGTQYMASLETGELINGYTDIEKSAFWTDMVFYNKAYNKGLLDPDSFTQTNDDFGAKIKAGRYVATAPTRDLRLYTQMSEQDSETLAGIVAVPSENYVTFADKKVLTGDFPSWYTFVSAKTENAEACMRFLNVLHDLDTVRMMWSGIEGVHWNYVDGVPTMTDEMAQMIKANDPKLKEIGVRIGMYHLETVQASFIHPDGYPVDLNDTDEMRAQTLNFLDQDIATYYGVEYPGQAYTKLVAEGKTIDMRNDCSQLVSTYMPTNTTDVTRTLEKLKDILYRAIPELVRAKDQAEFDSIQARVLKDLADAGEAEVWEWVKSNYDEANAFVRPIFESAEW